jgi:hypothetical protein
LYSITWYMPPALFCFRFSDSLNFAQGASYLPPLPHRWDYNVHHLTRPSRPSFWQPFTYCAKMLSFARWGIFKSDVL